MNRIARLFFIFLLLAIALFTTACGSGSQGGGGKTQNPTTPTLTVTPAFSSITTVQSLSVTVAVAGTGATPTGSVILSSGNYTSSATTLSSGSATITIPAGSLAAGTDTLTSKYTPDSASSGTYSSASGTASVTVTSPPTTPTVTVTPASISITIAQSLSVAIAVAGTGATPTGSVVLSSGSYTSAATTLSSGSATITISAGSLAAGTDTLTARYTPDSASSGTYNSASGTASVTVTASSGSAISVNIDTLANRHVISPYVYGGNISSTSTVSDSGTTLGRWGGNADVNVQLATAHVQRRRGLLLRGLQYRRKRSGKRFRAVHHGCAECGKPSADHHGDAGWVAQSRRTTQGDGNYHWSFPVATYGAQCSVDTYNTDAGDGLKSDCQTPVTTNAVTTAYYPLLDDNTPEPARQGTCVYRDAWAQALAAAFGSGTCAVPYFDNHLVPLLRHGQRDRHLGRHALAMFTQPLWLRRAGQCL
jgi:hypothetical protein